MTGDSEDDGVAATAPDLRLRGTPPRVTRLSRKVLVGLGSVAALAIAGAIGYALQGQRGGSSGQELYNVQNRPTADGLAALPKDYSGIPRQPPPLGPPLPGDLGPPMLNHGAAANTTVPAAGADPEAQRLAQEADAARVSKLFVSTDQPAQSNALPSSASTPASSMPQVPGQASPDPTSIENMQSSKIAFMNSPVSHDTVSPDRIAKTASPYVIQAGWVIPGALNTGIKSDIPGDVTAQVTENIYDSPTGRYLLIPQGSRLFGKYSSEISFAQTRVQMVWTRIIFPNGSSIVLQNLPGADTQGYSGLEDEVDNHWGALFKAAILSTVLSVGAEAGTSDSENNLAQAIREGASQSINQTGQQIVERNLNIQPTLTDRPGLPLRIIVDQDLALAPYPQEASR
ncbi:MAG: TrbI/VirB10 family protein [Acetobacteraceae bacterium]